MYYCSYYDCNNLFFQIKHIARNKNEVTVYKSDHKNADDFDEIERNEERDDVDLDEAEHFTIDEDFIYIHTKSLRLFCFVESNRRISFSDDVTISVHSRVLSCLVELRVFAYDNAILHERHLQVITYSYIDLPIYKGILNMSLNEKE